MRHTRKHKVREYTETNYWQSYSDMMAALLMIFILMIAGAVLVVNNYQDELLEKEAELAKQGEEYIRLKEELLMNQEKIDRIIGVKSEIIKTLSEEMSKQNIELTIDDYTGAIVFDASILYDKDEDLLKTEGIEFLDRFMPIYVGVLFDQQFKDDIAEIIIEGHTDTVKDYMYNLELSQRRALSVVTYCLSECDTLTKKQQQELRSIITANGKSFSNPIYNKAGEVDKDRSRRVEVKFRLKDEEMIQELRKIMEEMSQ